MRSGRFVLAALTFSGFIGLALYNRARAKAATATLRKRDLVKVGRVELQFVDRGGGLPLVLLHGNGSAIEDFEIAGTIESAAGRYRVIAFDRPGFGTSSAYRVCRPPAAQADLVHSALNEIGVHRYLVLGHSWGTLVALQLALRHRAHVAGLVLISGYYYPRLRPALFFASFPAVPIVGSAFRASILPFLARLVWPLAMRKIFGPACVPEAFSRSMREVATRPSQLKSIAVESWLLLVEAFQIRGYHKIAVPTGIVAGAGDQFIEASKQARRLHQAIEGSLIEVVDAGHMVHHTRSEAVLQMVERVARAAEPRRSGDAA